MFSVCRLLTLLFFMSSYGLTQGDEWFGTEAIGGDLPDGCPLHLDLTASSSWKEDVDDFSDEVPDQQWMSLIPMPKERNPMGEVTISVPDWLFIEKAFGAEIYDFSDHKVVLKTSYPWAEALSLFGTSSKKVHFDAFGRDPEAGEFTIKCKNFRPKEIKLSAACTDPSFGVKIDVETSNDHFIDSTVLFENYIVGSRVMVEMPRAPSASLPRVEEAYRMDSDAKFDSMKSNIPYNVIIRQNLDREAKTVHLYLGDCPDSTCSGSEDPNLGMISVTYEKDRKDPSITQMIFTLGSASGELEPVSLRDSHVPIMLKLRTNLQPGYPAEGIPHLMWCHLPREPPAPPPSPLPPFPKSPPSPPHMPRPSPPPKPPPPLPPPGPQSPPPPPWRPKILVHEAGVQIMGYHEPIIKMAPSLPPGSVVMGVQHDDIRDFLDMPVYVSVATIVFMIVGIGLWLLYVKMESLCPRKPKLSMEQADEVKSRLQERRLNQEILDEEGGEEGGDAAAGEYDEEEGDETQEKGQGYQAVDKAKRPTPTVMMFPRKNPNRLAGAKYTGRRH